MTAAENYTLTGTVFIPVSRLVVALQSLSHLRWFVTNAHQGVLVMTMRQSFVNMDTDDNGVMAEWRNLGGLGVRKRR